MFLFSPFVFRIGDVLFVRCHLVNKETSHGEVFHFRMKNTAEMNHETCEGCWIYVMFVARPNFKCNDVDTFGRALSLIPRVKNNSCAVSHKIQRHKAVQNWTRQMQWSAEVYQTPNNLSCLCTVNHLYCWPLDPDTVFCSLEFRHTHMMKDNNLYSSLPTHITQMVVNARLTCLHAWLHDNKKGPKSFTWS